MKLADAIKRMRELTDRNVPFSIGYITCNTTNGTSKGYKEVDRVMLRKGYSKAHSNKYNTLIAYTNIDTEDPRSFYLPLLMMFNGNTIQP